MLGTNPISSIGMTNVSTQEGLVWGVELLARKYIGLTNAVFRTVADSVSGSDDPGVLEFLVGSSVVYTAEVVVDDNGPFPSSSYRLSRGKVEISGTVESATYDKAGYGLHEWQWLLGRRSGLLTLQNETVLRPRTLDGVLEPLELLGGCFWFSVTNGCRNGPVFFEERPEHSEDGRGRIEQLGCYDDGVSDRKEPKKRVEGGAGPALKNQQ
jgi:hypothetical protein